VRDVKLEISLPRPAAIALHNLAKSEFRSPWDLASLIIQLELQRRGLLSQDTQGLYTVTEGMQSIRNEAQHEP
jgi:hypothetical protein